MKRAITLTAISAMTLSALAAGPEAPAKYPSAPADGTVDEYFGTRVPDPYRPLENDTSAATAAWVQAENELTRSYLDAIPFRTAVHNRLTALNDYKKQGMPSRENDGLFYFSRNDGLSNQASIYRSATPDGADAELFLDPNTLSDDGTVALTGLFQSPDGRYTAYTVSRSGSDWTEIYVMDTATRQLLPDHIKWAKFTGAAWMGNDGFCYSAYGRPEQGREYSMANEYHKVYFHRLGSQQADDTIIYENPAEPLHFHTADVTEGGRYLVVAASGAGNGNALHVKDLSDPDAGFVTIEPSQEQIIEVLAALPDGRLLAYTGIGAPNYRLVAIDPAHPARADWEEIVAESPDGVLAQAALSQSDIVLVYDRDASHHVFLQPLGGGPGREITLPGYGTVGISASKKHPELLYSFTGFTCPSTVYAYDKATDVSTPISTPQIDGFDPEAYVTEQVFYTSADGTRVPMFLTYRKDLRRDGTNPVYLYGYGGFNVPLNPSFNPNRLLWLENGGIYAQANLRGGSEYGEKWHEAGTKMQKQNVFDDFIAAAEWLVQQGWTTPGRLTIEGGSNGGLLVGACANQRPELFAVAIPRVGVMDMMRYHLFTIGWNWAHDYGTSADSPEMAAYLLGYSPLHNIGKSGRDYPAIMVTTADHDDRVVPAHSFKYAATLQATPTGPAPKLIRIDSKAGHGAGKPVSKVIDEWADIYSFVFHNLGITPATR